MQIEVALNTNICISLSFLHAEVAHVSLRIESQTGIDAPMFGQFNGVVPSKLEVGIVQCHDGAISTGRLVILEERIYIPCRMPAADSGTCIGIETQLIEVLVGIDRTYQANERVFGTRKWF